MRPKKVEEISLVRNLLSEIRSKGYAGSSLNDLAAISGLKKASLYHRYPGGKKDIVLSVLKYLHDWDVENISNVINDANIPSDKKLEKIVNAIDVFYDGGNNSCVMKTLSLDNDQIDLNEHLQKGMFVFLDGFESLAKQFGFNEKNAMEIAEQVIIQIQGSLILSKILQSNKPFKKALLQIYKLYNR